MRFCEICDRAMVRDPSMGKIVFRCPCGNEKKGDANDVRIGGASLNSAETSEMYHLLIENAPMDRTNQLVARNCVKCGLDYMTQIRVGESEVIIYKCKCGLEESPADT